MKRRNFLRSVIAAVMLSPLVIRAKDPAEIERTSMGHAVVKYIICACEDDPSFDQQKLNAMVFEIDRRYFLETGKTLTGFTYLKTENGIEFQ